MLALALAEHIDEVTLLTRPSYAKWTLQTGRLLLNLICTSNQLPVNPRPGSSAAESVTQNFVRTVCQFTDRFPSRIPSSRRQMSIEKRIRQVAIIMIGLIKNDDLCWKHC